MDLGKDWNAELLEAAREGNLKNFKKAYSNGAEINITNVWGQSPLILASQNGCVEIIQSILFLHSIGLPVKLNRPCNAGYTPFMHAIISRYTTIAKMLSLHLNASEFMAKDNAGCTAFMWAAQKGDLSILTLMLSRFDMNEIVTHLEAQDGLDYTALMLAAEQGEVSTVAEMIPYILKHKPDILNKVNCWGQTAANLAAEKGNIAVFRILQKAGADLTIEDHNKQTPLLYLKNNASFQNRPDDEIDAFIKTFDHFSFCTPSAPPADALFFTHMPSQESKETSDPSIRPRRRLRLEHEPHFTQKSPLEKKVKQDMRGKPHRRSRSECEKKTEPSIRKKPTKKAR